MTQPTYQESHCHNPTLHTSFLRVRQLTENELQPVSPICDAAETKTLKWKMERARNDLCVDDWCVFDAVFQSARGEAGVDEEQSRKRHDDREPRASDP